MPAAALNGDPAPAGLKALAEVLPVPSPDELAVMMAESLEEKRELFEAGYGGTAWQSWNGAVYYTTSNTTASITTSVSGNTVWTEWNGQYATGYTTSTTSPAAGWGTWNAVYTEYRESEEQRLAREAAQAEAAAQFEVRETARRQELATAKARAEGLLLSMLSDAQRATYGEHGWFEVRGSRSGRRYRIRNRGQAGNVDLMPEIGQEREVSYCAHPQGVPDADAHLAQMLALVTDEDFFLRTANVSYRRPVQRAQPAGGTAGRVHVGTEPWFEAA